MERIDGRPSFLRFATVGPTEVVSRARLDTRQVLPFFDKEGVRHVGVLRRARTSRHVRGDEIEGLEPIGIDFSGVDETGDILEYGRAIFTRHASVTLDPEALVLPAPSVARSIGYLTELALPLAVPIHPPSARSLVVEWDGATHHVDFAPLSELRARLETARHDEVLTILLGLVEPVAPASFGEERPEARAFLAEHASRIWDAERLVGAAHEADDTPAGTAIEGRALRFLRAVEHEGIEVVTPSTGESVAVLPWVTVDGEPWFVLWRELRPAAAERARLLPIHDLPIGAWFVNATARFVPRELALACAGEEGRTRAATHVLGAVSPRVSVLSCRLLGRAESAPACSSEVRTRLACALDPAGLRLPDGAILVRGEELRRAVAAGVVRDPVVVAGLVDLGLDPFAEVRAGAPATRRAFVDAMTRGSTVLRRLRAYSSIEAEQLEAPTYARLMTHLQARHGVRIVYPERPEDRGFFKAAFRVFMADDRGGDRALQGLHWSHDAFHFALGNYTPAVSLEDFVAAYVSDEEREPAPPEGPAFEAFARALEAAEDEATFFSFYTLFDEHPPLARHVPKLTFHAALRAIGVDDRETARTVFDALCRAELPARAREHPAYAARADVRDLCTYMLGFHEYHLGDIRRAWRAAGKDLYRAIFVRLGLYETDVERYLASVRGFSARLARTPPGFPALAAHAANVRLEIALRGFDVSKALRLCRTRTTDRAATCREFLGHLAVLVDVQRRLEVVEARVLDAELSSRNEHSFEQIERLAGEVAAIHRALWDSAAKVLPEEVVAEERARTLPR
ncbi:MAG: hypothetical protein JNL79_21250 [Myxococcales bacterium]|nr:hypothetical protein [Myxococcales bacterium]